MGQEGQCQKRTRVYLTKTSKLETRATVQCQDVIPDHSSVKICNTQPQSNFTLENKPLTQRCVGIHSHCPMSSWKSQSLSNVKLGNKTQSMTRFEQTNHGPHKLKQKVIVHGKIGYQVIVLVSSQNQSPVVHDKLGQPTIIQHQAGTSHQQSTAGQDSQQQFNIKVVIDHSKQGQPLTVQRQGCRSTHSPCQAGLNPRKTDSNPTLRLGTQNTVHVKVRINPQQEIRPIAILRQCWRLKTQPTSRLE